MTQKIKVILDMSDEVQTFLEQQQINIYEDLQQAVPSLQLRVEPDPEALEGSRDVTTVILALATLASSLTPLIIRILNQYTPPNRSIHWEIEETEKRNSDGTVIIQRKRIRSCDEQRPWAASSYPDPQSSEKSSLPDKTNSNQK